MLSRRAFLSHLAAAGAAVGLLSACGPAAPQAAPTAPSGQPTAKPAAAPTQQQLNVPQSISTSGPAASATAAPTTAPASGKPEPKGQFNYVWHTTISPAWFDPQENPPQITPYNFAYALHDALVKHMPGQSFATS